MNYLMVDSSKAKPIINPNIYGHFSEHLGRCIYGGLFVGKDSPIPNDNGMRRDVVQALKRIKIPVLRWPGGCFADTYHWQDGIGAPSARKKMVNTHWGGQTEDNSFGTHEFMELCRQIGCEPYVNGNLGSGTVQEMSEWVEYMTFPGQSPMADLRRVNGQESPWKVPYWGIGNENWGCGGNMRPEFYADLYRQFQTYIQNFGENRIMKIACGANGDDYQWTEKVMEIAAPYMDALSLHYYTVPGESWQKKGSAVDFSADEYYRTIKKALKMDELIKKHGQIMSRYDPQGRVGLVVDEWGNWFDVEPGTNPGFLYQQNTMRDGITAALTLNIFNRNCDRVVMANLAQTVNVLQALILTEGDRLILTPTYHVFDLYKGHQGNRLLESSLVSAQVQTDEGELSALDCSVSQDEKGVIHLTLVNVSLETSERVSCIFSEGEITGARGDILRADMKAHNRFSAPDEVCPRAFSDLRVDRNCVIFEMPPVSVLALEISMGGVVSDTKTV